MARLKTGLCRLTSSRMRAAIYARVSTEDQKYEMQLHDLRAYVGRQGWDGIEYLEKESSVKRRPVFERMLQDARQGKLNVILVWRVDRFARSMKDFVTITLQLDAWKVRLISITEAVDTGDQNPFAEFQRGLLALLAQLERKIIVARVRAGVGEYQRAFSSGRVGNERHSRSGRDLAHGRPARIFRRDQAVKLREKGQSWREIAHELHVPVSTVRDAVRGMRKTRS